MAPLASAVISPAWSLLNSSCRNEGNRTHFPGSVEETACWPCRNKVSEWGWWQWRRSNSSSEGQTQQPWRLRKSCRRSWLFRPGRPEPDRDGPTSCWGPPLTAPPGQDENRLKTCSCCGQQQPLAGVLGSSLDLLTHPVGGPAVVYKPANEPTKRMTHINLQTWHEFSQGQTGSKQR